MIRWALPLALIAAVPATAQTQAAMTAEANAAWKSADSALNAQWKRTSAFMKDLDAHGPPSGRGNALLDAQRAWLSYRDNHCQMVGQRYAGGSMEPMARAQCMAAVTRERTKQLKDLVWQR